MVVVPTSHHVTLSYGTTTVDWIGKAASVAGLVGIGALAFRPGPDVGPDPAADPVTASPTSSPPPGPSPEPMPMPGPGPGTPRPPTVWGETYWETNGDPPPTDGESP